MNKTLSYKSKPNYKSLDNLNYTNKTKRIILNKKSDLINIPLQQLRTTQLQNFCGALFEQIYEEALAIEHSQKIKKYYSEKIEPYKSNKTIKITNKRNQNKEQNDNKIEINKINFEIKYDTSYGEEVGILGSNNTLGNWDVNNIFYLKWNYGNIWKGKINVDKPYKNFEFKFVVTFGGNIKYWENGDNNKILFESICNDIKHKKNGCFNKYEYIYDNVNNELYLKCRWN